MKILIFILAFGFIQDVPFKPSEEFDIKLDYQFKLRPSADHNTVNLGKQSQRTNTGVLPYLVLHIRLLKLPDERTRVSITNNLNQRPAYKKVTLSSVLELDLGFTHDMVDRVTANEYTVTFINADKQPVDRIVISVGEDGSFLVNGEKRGKF